MTFNKPLRILESIIILAFIVFILALTFPNPIIMAQQSICNGSIILNLTPASQVWCVSRVYQGVYINQPVNTYPIYYGPNSAYRDYWSLSNIKSNYPVLELVRSRPNSTGAIFWSGYYEGGSVTIMFVGTYTTGKSYIADGFEVYLFVMPSGWSTISPSSNYSIPFATSYTAHIIQVQPIQVGGLYMFPYAIPNTRYIIVQWDPFWSYGYPHSPPNGGDWNVLVVIGNGNSTPSVISVIGGVGSGGFEPNPGDLIVVKVTYDPSTNTVSGYAYDLNTKRSASFSYNLDGYFTPPSPGYYTFGIAANTGADYANWGVMSISEEGIKYIPVITSSISTRSNNFSIIVKTSIIIIILFGIILLIGRKK